MTRISVPGIAVIGLLCPSVAMAKCDVPGNNASDAEFVALFDCITEHVKMERAAHDGMAARLRDLYMLLDDNGEKRLDDNQAAWRARTDGMCPPKTNDGADIIGSTECETKRYTERSVFLDEIIAGCRAGACAVDKL